MPSSTHQATSLRRIYSPSEDAMVAALARILTKQNPQAHHSPRVETKENQTGASNDKRK